MALDALLLGGSSSAIARGCSHCGASADRSLPSIKVDDADAATWRLALQFLDPNNPNAEQPEVDCLGEWFEHAHCDGLLPV
jgi:hypothetical protein